jgi:aminopeptidase N
MHRLCKYTILCFLFISVFGNKLGAADHAKEMELYDVKFYFFDLCVSNDIPGVDGSVALDIQVLSDELDSIVLQLVDSAIIDSILVNQINTHYLHSNDFIRIPVEGTSAGDMLTVRVYYHLMDISEPNNRGISTYRSSDGRSLAWSLSEPFYAKKWFPCKQILTDKADSSYLFFTVRDSLMVGSNGLLRNKVPLDSGWVRYEWVTTYPMAYYLPSFAVADYLDYSFYAKLNAGDSVLIQNFIPDDSSYLALNKEAIDATAKIIEVFSSAFGLYPFLKEKYGHCVAPLGGGMEHQTMTTIDNFDFELVAHELAHQWFGDYVTCNDWQDIWINEGFASYAELIAIEAIKPAERNDWLLDAYSLSISENGGSVYIPEVDSANDDRIFDYRLTYRKGAYLLHMIRHQLNDDSIFFAVLRKFIATYGNETAGAIEFRNILEELSGRSFETFFNQWYYGEGHPVFSIRWEHSNDSLKIYLSQHGSSPLITPFFNVIVDFKISYFGGDTLVKFYQDQSEMVYSIPFNKKVYKISLDNENWILKEILSTKRILTDDSVRFSIFPNPANDVVYVENVDIGLSFNVEIYDSKGVLFHKATTAEVFMQIDLENFLKGVYQVVVSRKNHQEFFQLVKL